MFYRIVFLCLLFQWGRMEGVSLDEFHICTVASQKTPGLEKLLHTCSEQGIEIDILGFGLSYRGNGKKLTYVKQYIQNLPDDHVVLFVDGYDVLFLADKATLLEKFLSFNAPFVISAEKNCYPYSGDALKYPNSPTPFKYLNSGGYIGYVGFIKKMLDSITIDEGFSDQGQLTRYFLNNNFPFVLDYYSVIFLCLHLAKPQEIKIDHESRSVYHLITHSSPCIIHDNGYNEVSFYQKIYEELFP